MASSTSTKSTGNVSAWSEWHWDIRGFAYSERLTEFGEREYKYRDCQTDDETHEESRAIYSTPRSAVGDPDAGRSYNNDLEDRNKGSSSRVQEVSSSISYSSYTTRDDLDFPYPPSQPHVFSTNSKDAHYTFPEPSYERSTFASAVPLSVNVRVPQYSSPSWGSVKSSKDYPTGSMTQGLAHLSLDSTRRRSSQSYDEPNEGYSLETSGNANKLIQREQDNSPFEVLDSRYREVETKKLKKFWRVGRVFMMLWTEPTRAKRSDSSGSSSNSSHYSTTYLDGNVYTEIRRFVVISLNHGSAVCSPIHTYMGQATLKPNLPEVQQHAIIYSSKTPPPEAYILAEDGTRIYEDLTKVPIRVVREQESEEGDLGQHARINFSKIYTVENYVRVLNIGMVHSSSMDSLIQYARIKQREDSPQPPRHKMKLSSQKDDKGSINSRNWSNK